MRKPVEQNLVSNFFKAVDVGRKGLNQGLRTRLDGVDEVIDGVTSSTMTVILGGTGSGKALPMDAKIITPSGVVEMKDVNVGDSVIGSNGNKCKVLGVYPQGIKRVYDVEFDDGSVSECCKDHLWSVSEFKNRKKKKKDLTTMRTEDMMNNVIIGKSRKNYSIPFVSPVEFEEKNLLLDPYILGLLLGDGSLRDKESMRFSNTEEDIIKSMSEYFNLKHIGGCDYRITNCKKQKDFLRDLGLIGSLSNSKFIPEIYKINSVENRLSILQGLIDSDGYVYGNSIEFVTVSKTLSDDVKFLTESLGGRCVIGTKKTSYSYKNEKKSGQLAYRLYITFGNDIVPFRSIKHESRYANSKQFNSRFIKSITKTDKFKEMQCIMVDSEDSLFATNNFLLTHNTTYSMYYYIYEPLCQAIEAGEQFYGLIFSLEMSADMLMAKLLSLRLFDEHNMVFTYKDIMSRKEPLNDTDFLLLKQEEAWLIEATKNLVVIDKQMTGKGITDYIVNYMKQHGDIALLDNKFIQDDRSRKIVVMVDHVGLLSVGAGNNLKKEIDDMSSTMVSLRNMYGISPVLVQQLNRSSNSMDRRKAGLQEIELQDAKDTGSTLQDADVVIGLYFPHREKVEQYLGYDIKRFKDRFRGWLCLKNRFGEVGARVPICFWGELGFFKSIKEETQEQISDIKLYLSPKYKNPNYDWKEEQKPTEGGLPSGFSFPQLM